MENETSCMEQNSLGIEIGLESDKLISFYIAQELRRQDYVVCLPSSISSVNTSFSENQEFFHSRELCIEDFDDGMGNDDSQSLKRSALLKDCLRTSYLKNDMLAESLPLTSSPLPVKIQSTEEDLVLNNYSSFDNSSFEDFYQGGSFQNLPLPVTPPHSMTKTDNSRQKQSNKRKSPRNNSEYPISEESDIDQSKKLRLQSALLLAVERERLILLEEENKLHQISAAANISRQEWPTAIASEQSLEPSLAIVPIEHVLTRGKHVGLYAPVKFRGKKSSREGLCPICPEETWFKMRT
ncbi:hypothetical protein ROZALSC1DRAFT_29984, partial [Rozella allomycis CSF55]